MSTTRCVDVFCACVKAMNDIKLLDRTRDDKEFHFQKWFADRLADTSIAYDRLKRNSYPDFVLPSPAEGYEVKGVESGGRLNRGSRDFDSNSQVPKGLFNDRVIFYVFGRYPIWQQGTSKYPITDLVICHGDFLNADRGPVPSNQSLKVYGSYGDILVRDTKMYVAPTPFGLTDGLEGNRTLILPASMAVPDGRIEAVGNLERTEAAKVLTAYTFDFPSDTLTGTLIDNPRQGTVYAFVAFRLKGAGGEQVKMRTASVGSPTDPPAQRRQRRNPRKAKP